MTCKEQINIELEKLNYIGLTKALEQITLITLIPSMQKSPPVNKPQPLIDGKRIRQLRKMRKLTQSELAKLAGISLMSVRRYETMDRVPRADTMNKMMSVLEEDINYD